MCHFFNAIVKGQSSISSLVELSLEFVVVLSIYHFVLDFIYVDDQ